MADALHPEVGGRALDDWLAHFGVDCAVRHQAAADTLATAELLLRLWPAARRQRCTTFTAWQQLAAQRHDYMEQYLAEFHAEWEGER